LTCLYIVVVGTNYI